MRLDFFHCAYTRYEKGLTIEEIWERKPAPPTTEEMAASASTNEKSPGSVGDDSNSVELTFESDDGASYNTDGDVSSLEASSLPPLTPGATATNSSNLNIAGLSTTPTSTSQSGSSKSPPVSVASYEIVDALGKEDSINGLENDDTDLDDLEAEIARELEED